MCEIDSMKKDLRGLPQAELVLLSQLFSHSMRILQSLLPMNTIYDDIETMVLDKMKADKRISIKQLSKIFGKSKTSMFRIVDNLKADGKVRRYGSEKSGTWEVIE